MKRTIYIRQPVHNELEVTKLVTIHYFEYTKGYEYRGERHKFRELIYVDRGRAVITHGDETHPLTQGEAILVRPDAFHSIRADDKAPCNVMIVSFEAVGEGLPLLDGRVFALRPDLSPLLRSVLDEGHLAFVLPMQNPQYRCLKARPGAVYGSQQLIRLRLEELLIRLVRRVLNAEQPPADSARYDPQIAGRTMELLQSNLYARLSLSDLTDLQGYSKTYLSSLFKRVYGQSIMECYNRLKIEEAKYLLREGRHSVQEVAELLQFTTPQYFSRKFSELVQMSPRQYAVSVRGTWVDKP